MIGIIMMDTCMHACMFLETVAWTCIYNYARVSSSGGGRGEGKLPLQSTQLPPPLPPKKERRKEGKEEREALGAGRGREYESMRSRV